MRSALSIGVAALLAGCGASQSSITLPSRPSEIVVKPGQSIQTAVDRAQAGDTIVVEPGVYRETGRACAFDASQTCAVSVTKDAIALIGRAGTGPVVLANAGQVSNGIAVGTSTDCAGRRVEQSRVTGFVVKDFNVSGIVISCADRWELRDDRAVNDALYGFYASFAGYGRVSDSTVIGAARAGIHVGMSHDARIDHNVAHDNVTGFEVREDLRTTVDDNIAFNNTAGIFESIMPGDPLERNINNTLSDNSVQDNNRRNECAKPSDPVCLIPPGVGIAIVGGARNLNLRNRIIGNRTFGIAVIDVCSAFEIPASRCDRLGFNPLPRFTRTERNVALGNRVDLLWTRNGRGNCWLDNRSKVREPRSLPHCQ